MRNAILLSACLFLYLTLILPGCGKDSIESDTSMPEINVVTILEESQVTLKWDTKNAESCFLDNEPIPLKGDASFSRAEDKNYVFVSKNKNGETKKEVFVSAMVATIPAPEIVNFIATPNPLPIGGGIVTLTYSTLNATSVEYGTTSYPPSGSFQTGWVLNDTIITIVFKGPGGEISRATFIPVTPTPPPPTVTELLLGTWDHFSSVYQFADEPNGEWHNLMNGPCTLDNTLTFRLPNKLINDFGPILCEGQTNRVMEGTWELQGMVLNNYATIIQIEGDTLVWTYPSVRINSDGITWRDIQVVDTFRRKE